MKKWKNAFSGRFLMVNGKVNPYLEVERTDYRFRILNGANARIFYLRLSQGTFEIIGLERGLLSAPVATNELRIAPGERFDVIVDFRKFLAGTEIFLQNYWGPTHASG